MARKEKKDAYQVITDHIISRLEAGIIPWQMPWDCTGTNAPINRISKKGYSGINLFLLASMGYSNPYWLTYKQAQQLGGTVNKGEKATPVVFWKVYDKESDKVDDETGELKMKRAFVLRYYSVFNALQCDDTVQEKCLVESSERDPIAAIPRAQAVIDNMPNPPAMAYGLPKAAYSPMLDKVIMPERDAFKDSESFYSVHFHELVHSTGHQSRLNRDGFNEPVNFGSQSYSKEELVAEMGAAFLCGHVGIESKTIDNSVAYIQGWLKKLKNDSKFVISAASKAKRAVEYITNTTTQED